MIRVTVELFPLGNEKFKRTLGRLDIVRWPGKPRNGAHTYSVRQYSGTRCIRTANVQYSQNHGFWKLIRDALLACAPVSLLAGWTPKLAKVKFK